MKGIYYINENISLNGQPKIDSFQLQKDALIHYIEEEQIQVAKLNPFQLYDHYTLLHALLFDLKKEGIQLDCLILYSPKVLDEFIASYSARWLLIKSYFNEVITFRS